MLDRYEYLLARSVERHRGRVVKNTGDGALATFTSATMALQAAYDCEVLRANLACGREQGFMSARLRFVEAMWVGSQSTSHPG